MITFKPGQLLIWDRMFQYLFLNDEAYIETKQYRSGSTQVVLNSIMTENIKNAITFECMNPVIKFELCNVH